MTNAELTAAFSSLSVGDVVRVNFDGGSRKVTITNVDGKYVGTSAGMQTSRTKGGVIVNGWHGDESGIAFQATWSQPMRAVTSIEPAN